ncbi:MAG: peptidoglycan-associated lipoprotein Pal, partial [Methylocella sp.]
MSILQRTGELKFAAALGAALAISACAKAPAEDPAALAGLNGGRAAPGSPQDFAISAGDRVFFDSDSSELSGTAQATLAKQVS